MHTDRILRAIAGTFILASVALGMRHDPRWFWFTAFVGANLLQSAFTNWCPMITFLKALGVPESCARTKPGATKTEEAA